MRFLPAATLALLPLLVACGGDSSANKSRDSAIEANQAATVRPGGDSVAVVLKMEESTPPQIARRHFSAMDSYLWLNWEHKERREALERLSLADSEWAKETLRRIDEGEIEPSELSSLEPDYVKAVMTTGVSMYPRRSRLASDGCAPMPFGRSMHGPWSVGGMQVVP